jgi:ABC-type Mn2+/Zn2+ transport system ATPase subunit
VDPGTQREILGLLRERNGGGMTIVMATHDIDVVAAHLPRLVCIDRRIVADGPPAEVLSPEILDGMFGPKVVAAGQPGPARRSRVRAV